MSIKTISPNELNDELQSDRSVDLLDVRTPIEYREVHAEGAKLVPLGRFDPKVVLAERSGKEGDPIYVLCRTGSRAKKACRKFEAAGFDQAVCVDGGIMAWEDAGLPVKRSEKVVSLERQVRIAAGILILLGSLLGYFVHPYYIALPAFVGAGLFFAGITNSCGMAALLARMPWNNS